MRHTRLSRAKTTDQTVSEVEPLSEHRAQLAPKLDQWRDHLRRAGLDGLAGVLLGFAPLGVVGAQVLWVAQPALNIFLGGAARADINALARVLAEPGGATWLAAGIAPDGQEN
jgi:hypothetical protein